MAALKSAYLVCGEDNTKIDSWRSRVRRRAEEENGAGALESFDARAETPEAVAASLSALTFGGGTRYVMVDGVESWKPAVLEPLERELASPAPDTVLVLVARGKSPDRLRKAVEQAGGEIREYEAPKPRELPRWTIERAAEEGLKLDLEAARALVGAVGNNQQRLSREVEKLALLAHPKDSLSAEQIQRLASGEAGGQGYDLGDAVVAGDLERSLRLAERLVERGERPGRLIYPILSGLRRSLRAAELVDAGVSESGLAKELRVPPWLAKKIGSQARRADRDALERALCAFADLEVRMRNGDCVDDESGLTLALARAAA
ncbi:MAG: polymerase subunit delta [Thermoleophilaceae bacterium]|nr:polymerase subunit delta [Thermoleophilaceae bacterium]